jgi:hypothetical protein
VKPDVGGPRPLVARTSAQWVALWRSLGRDPLQPLPGGRTAIGVVAAPCGACGRTVEIVDVASARGGFELRHREACPPPTCTLFVPSSACAVELTRPMAGAVTLVDVSPQG